MPEIMEGIGNLDNCLNQREVGAHSICMIYYSYWNNISVCLETGNC